MTEAGMMGAEDANGGGFRIWTDMFLIEVLDPDTNAPVAEGEIGSLVVTPLWTNNVTPFLRWSSGDLVTWREASDGDGPFSVFPLVKHAHRTTGFFKVRGINLNHAEFEDFMFRDMRGRGLQGGADERARSRRAAAVDRAAARRGAEPVADGLRVAVRDTFGLTPGGRRAGGGHARAGVRGERQDAALRRPAAIGANVQHAARPGLNGRSGSQSLTIGETRHSQQRGEHENRNHSPRRDAPALLSLGAAQAQDKLKIGIIATLSGPPAVLGGQLRNGFLLGVKQLGGKLGGREVEVIVQDDELKPDVAVSKVKALVERDKVDFVVGPIFSNILQAIMKPATDGGAILIRPNAGTSNFAGKDCNPNFFVTSYQNDQNHEVLGKYAQDKGIKKVVHHGAELPGRARTRSPASSATSRARCVDEVYVPLNQLDYSAELSKIAAAAAGGDLRVPAGRHGRELRQAVPPGRARRQDHRSSPPSRSTKARCRRSRTPRSASSAARTGRRTSTTRRTRRSSPTFEKEYSAVPGSYAFQAYDAALLIDSRAEGDRRQDRQQGRAARRAEEGRLHSRCAAPSSSTPTTIRSRTSIW